MRVIGIALACIMLLSQPALAQSPLDIIRSLTDGVTRDSAPPDAGSRPSKPIPTLRSQLTRSQVQRLQRALEALGYYHGPIDGDAGAETWSSVVVWARDRGWEAPTTLRVAHLNSLEAERAQGRVAEQDRPGSGPEDGTVRRVQSALSRLGYYSGPVNGQTDQATMAAMAAWAADRSWEAPASIREAHAVNMEEELSHRTGPVVGDAALPPWQPDDTGIGSKVCASTGYSKVCLRLACDAEAGVVLDFEEVAGYATPSVSSAGLTVDRGPEAMLPLDGIRKRPVLDAGRDAALIARLSSGRSLNLKLGTWSISFGLAQFGPEYDRVGKACATLLARLRSGEDPFPGQFSRLADELAEATVSEGTWTSQPNTDLGGNDIRHGLADPLLRGLTEGECIAICSETDMCRAYTFNPSGGACFLKSAKGSPKPYAAAKSGVFDGRKAGLAPPPTRGPGPIVDGAVGWHEGETLDGFQARVKQAARRLGGSCDEEKETLRRLAEKFQWKLPHEGPLRAGNSFAIEWSGNTLEDRIPVWFMVKAEQPVRFKGKGHVALGPAAPNPFAIKTGLGQTRAMVALATRGAGAGGSVSTIPLQAGPLNLSVSLVGYLRACEEEIVLKEESERLDIAPAPAEIVLNTAEGRAAFTHSIDIPKFSRRILLNDTRFLLLDAASGTEIVERAGTHLQISPTHRFIGVEHNGRLDIVDMVDGHTAATADAGDLRWALGDSIVFTTLAPWAEVNFASTFGDHLRIREQITGPSCCTAERGQTRVAIDLENAAYAIWGGAGYRVGALQNPDYASIANSSGAYSSAGGETIPLHFHMFWSLGMVSPVSVAREFDVAGGFRTTSTWEDWEVADADSRRPRDFTESLSRALGKIELQAVMVDTTVASGDQGSTRAGNDTPLAAALPEQLLRLGVALDPMVDGERLVASYAAGEKNALHALDRDQRLKRSAEAMGRFRREAERAGWRFDWALPVGEEGPTSDCEHLLLGESSSTGGTGSLSAPRDVVEVSTVRTSRGAVWVARAECVAGATFGSLRPYAALYVMDIARPAPAASAALQAEGAFFFENNAHRLWYQHAFRIKANDDLLLTYAPGNGVITVRDRATQKFLWIGENLPNGDLLVDAWLTKDRRHAVQLNSDGNFYIHAILDDRQSLLSGRIADDEIAVWTKDYFYDATAEAAALIDLKFPGRVGQYSLDRFGTARLVPDLARAVLDRGQTPQAVAEVGVPPSLTGEIALEENGGRVRAVLHFDPAETVHMSVFQDGVLTETVDAATVGDAVSFERLKDARWVSVIGFNAGGLASLPVSADLGEPLARRAVTRALVIGVNTYEDERLRSLNYPLRDAGTVLETLTEPLGKEPPFLGEAGPKDRRATPEAILEATARLLDGLARGDHAVLFLAGHGMQDRNGRFYFATSATDPTDLEHTALPFDRLAALFERTEARITILLDACHSGAAGTGSFTTNDDLANSLAALRSNLTVLAAAKGRQESLGRREVGGLFTNAIVTVLGKERDRYDHNHNGRIEASELYRGVKTLVFAASDGKQTPWIINSRLVGDYALF
ncbi:peptidase C14 caspase catalytic subunit p20 (plasmid) [Rhizobium leguminosarum]|nr:peptidase C14 caspase catalytic subunit p20 [Rhizobium leguminosarum]